MGLKDKVENNPTLFLLGALVTGFLAGLGAYEGTLRIAGQEVVSKGEMDQSRQEIEVLRRKERFLSLFLRFEQAAPEDMGAARDELDGYIQEFIEEADRPESVIGVGKGSGKQTTIKFPDGSIWIVPPDFRSATGN